MDTGEEDNGDAKEGGTPTAAQTPPPTIALRAATAADRPAMLRAMSPYRNAFVPDGLPPESTLVATLGDDVVGFVGWRGDHLLALYAAASWRGGRQVGPALLHAAEVAMMSAGRRRTRVRVDADAPRTIAFYIRHDYSPEDGRNDEDVAWLSKALAATR